ncbi:prepilin peptidase [Patescibacteria group bacterium]|nr:prepilin peptidase [Patescibacteria group bacterium]
MVISIILIAGLVAGSFVNAFVWRLHEHKDWIKGRSECIYCHHPLGVVDLIPVVSWIAIKGKCRYCHKAISIQYPIVEALLSAVYVLSYLFWPNTIKGAEIVVFMLWLIISTGLVALAIYDVRWMLLPSKIIYSLLAASSVMALITTLISNDRLSTFLSFILGSLVGGGLFYVIFQVSKGKWIGGGDVRLGFLVGLLAATPARSLLLLFIASLLGATLTLCLIATRRLKRSSLVPFGPFLIIATFIVQLAGQPIIHWYSSLFLK